MTTILLMALAYMWTFRLRGTGWRWNRWLFDNNLPFINANNRAPG